MLRVPLEFTLVGSRFGYTDPPVSKAMIYMELEGKKLVLCNHVMRGGRHVVSFIVTTEEDLVLLGFVGHCQDGNIGGGFALVPLSGIGQT